MSTFPATCIRYREEYDDEDEEGDVWRTCAIAPVKDDVACIFARSTRGEKEFSDFSVNQRAAVALARYLQDPLVEFAGEVKAALLEDERGEAGTFSVAFFSCR